MIVVCEVAQVYLLATFSSKTLAGIGAGDFLGDDFHTALYGIRILGIGNTNTLVLVCPFFVHADKKVVSWDDQNAASLESFV